jgi:hypothetical protein
MRITVQLERTNMVGYGEPFPSIIYDTRQRMFILAPTVFPFDQHAYTKGVFYLSFIYKHDGARSALTTCWRTFPHVYRHNGMFYSMLEGRPSYLNSLTNNSELPDVELDLVKDVTVNAPFPEESNDEYYLGTVLNTIIKHPLLCHCIEYIRRFERCPPIEKEIKDILFEDLRLQQRFGAPLQKRSCV